MNIIRAGNAFRSANRKHRPDRRLGYERRRIVYAAHIPERRKNEDRRVRTGSINSIAA